MQAVKSGHYHVGCTRLFEISHRKQGVKKGDGLGESESVSHPNRYFERSWSLVKESKKSSSSPETEEREETKDGVKTLVDRRSELQKGSASTSNKMEEDDDEDLEFLLQEAQRAEDDAMAVDA